MLIVKEYDWNMAKKNDFDIFFLTIPFCGTKFKARSYIFSQPSNSIVLDDLRCAYNASLIHEDLMYLQNFLIANQR